MTFSAAQPAILCDTNSDLINLYDWIRINPGLMHLDAIGEQEAAYYAAREKIREPFEPSPSRARAYYIVRQLCYRGGERYNKAGQFNLPVDHSKTYRNRITDAIRARVLRCRIFAGDYREALALSNRDSFVFLDPPYLDRNGYAADNLTGPTSSVFHKRLARDLFQVRSPWLMIHVDCELYREMYTRPGINLESYPLRYRQVYRSGANNEKAEVRHLAISNRSLAGFNQ